MEIESNTAAIFVLFNKVRQGVAFFFFFIAVIDLAMEEIEEEPCIKKEREKWRENV